MFSSGISKAWAVNTLPRMRRVPCSYPVKLYNGTTYGEHVDIVKVNDITTESTSTGKWIIIIARANNTSNILQIGLRCALAALLSSSHFHNEQYATSDPGERDTVHRDSLYLT